MTCVMPVRILEYGVSVWGACEPTTAVWEEVERFGRLCARMTVRIPLRTPSEAYM